MTCGLTNEEKIRMGREYADRLLEKGVCACCGSKLPLHMLDAKPERFACNGGLIARIFPSFRMRALTNAAISGENFTRLECKECYGPGWVQGVPVLIRPRTLKVGSK